MLTFLPLPSICMPTVAYLVAFSPSPPTLGTQQSAPKGNHSRLETFTRSSASQITTIQETKTRTTVRHLRSSQSARNLPLSKNGSFQSPLSPVGTFLDVTEHSTCSILLPVPRTAVASRISTPLLHTITKVFADFNLAQTHHISDS